MKSSSKICSLCARRAWWNGFPPGALILATVRGLAGAAEEGQPVPELRQPRPEIPPEFWEQHGWLVVVAALLAMALVALVVWCLTRPKPVVSTPPETLARNDLARLRQQPETDSLLSRVSQILRQYVIFAFGLSPGERTTTDLAAALVNDPRPGPELTSALLSFLRACDERKFSPPASPRPALGAVDRALQLIEQTEERRAALRQTEAKP